MTTPRTAEEERAAVAVHLNKRAAILRTPAGRIEAQWHQNDAEMVANELSRMAAQIRRGAHLPHPSKDRDNG